MNIDTLVEKLSGTGERFQVVELLNNPVLKVACGYRFPEHIKEVVEREAAEAGVEVELTSHLNVPVFAIRKMVSINGYTKFSW